MELSLQYSALTEYPDIPSCPRARSTVAPYSPLCDLPTHGFRAEQAPAGAERENAPGTVESRGQQYVR
jgi:hypothetical protein